MIEFKLPSLGSDMDRGTLLEWRIAPGQAVKKGDVVAVVDTSKAAIDVEVWVDGTVQELVTEVGQTIPVGSVMATLLAPGEVATGSGAAASPAQVSVPAAAPPPAAPPVPPPRAATTAAMRQAVSPAARRRAAELGVALQSLAGSAPDGVVRLDDVERAAAANATTMAAPPTSTPVVTPASPPPPPTGSDRAAQMRKVIAAAMARSKREIPHYYLSESVPMRLALDWLRVHNDALPVTQRLLPAVLQLKAVALALATVPELNGVLVDGAFRRASSVHLGVAVSLRQGGLVAPALHDVASKPLPQLMAELADLVQRARAGSLRSSELSDATITVTQLGDQGVESVFGVIHPPQVALVGLGRIAERPWVEQGRIVAMPLVTASLAADHRVSDGHRGALFLGRLRELLQRPQDL